MHRIFRASSLKTRIVLLVVALLLAGIWGLAARVTAVMQRDLERVLSDQLSATVGFVTFDMDLDLKEHVEALQRIAAAIKSDLLADSFQLERSIGQHEVARSAFDMNLTVAASDGLVVANDPPDDTLLGTSVADRRYFREVMTGGKTFIGPPLQEGSHGIPFVPLAVPIRDDAGATIGVLIDRISLDNTHPIGELIEHRIGKSGYFLLVAPENRRIISATDRERVMTEMPARGTMPLLDRRLDEGYEEPQVITTHLGVEMLTAARKMTMTGWMLIAAVPTAEAFAPIASLRQQIYLAAVVISLIIAVILWLALARQFARLDDAGEAMRRMSDGEQPLAAIPVTREDEIGHLAENFNRLVAERNRLDAELCNEINERRQAEENLGKAMARLQALSKRITAEREEERREVALELHEEAGQELMALKLQLEILRGQCGKEAQAAVRQALSIVRLMLTRVRDLALGLHPPQLDDFGLYAALRACCRQQAETAGWELHFDAPAAEDRPPRNVEVACYRVVEEALANAARHGDATEVWVELRRIGDELHLRVRDDGAGFDAVAIRIRDEAEHAGLGLIEMEELARQVGGRLEIQSNPGAGTEIRAVFPLDAPAATSDLQAA